LAITPQEIESKQFPVVFRGFEQQAVTGFLQSVAAHYKAALQAALENYTGDGASTLEAARPRDPVLAEDIIGDGVATILRAARHVSEEVRKRAETEAEALLSTARKEATATVAQSMREAEEILSIARNRVELLVRDEQELQNWLRAMRGDIESLLHREPPPPPPMVGDTQQTSALEIQQGWGTRSLDAVDVRDNPRGAITGPSDDLETSGL
jgi:DivIVA domain-containing protein